MKLFTPESWGKLSTAIEHTRTSGVPYELELEAVTIDGSNGWMWARGKHIKIRTATLFLSGEQLRTSQNVKKQKKS